MEKLQEKGRAYLFHNRYGNIVAKLYDCNDFIYKEMLAHYGEITISLSN